ncbi:unnamed protein product [Rotaria sp. Silwood2]|nr:unnamed protein product [Rotaria sp. Silwood2]CAF3364227.1 unnamed protein product [Rotaria sp. Silwood2]CAF4419425.1 unnamed protein product [Rotaria sp. Silwood2]
MLLDITAQLTRVVLILLVIFGTIGNVLDLFIFTRHRFLHSSCTLYFIAASIDNILAIYLAILNRLLIDGFSIDVGSLSPIICKLRVYVGYMVLALSPYFFILACFDRYCSSSPSIIHRSWSNKKTAKRCICGAIILAAILYLHMPIFFQIQSNGSNIICYPQQGIYDSFWRIFYLVIYCFFPSICMSLLCLLIAINIRHQSRQIRPALANIGDLHRRLDRNLIRILFSHFLTQTLCILPFAILNLLGMFVNRNAIIYVFFSRSFTLPLFASYTTNFYVNTMSSRIYRREFMKLFSFCKWKIFRDNQNIGPV